MNKRGSRVSTLSNAMNKIIYENSKRLKAGNYIRKKILHACSTGLKIRFWSEKIHSFFKGVV